ncbi:MAG: YajQ family cyclic di-GMP-binding protein [Aestuariibacter sp.]
MPSFDIVSEIELPELQNAVDNANREVETRFDFKGSDASFERKDNIVTLKADADFQLQQMMHILRNKLVKRSIDARSIDEQQVQTSGKGVKQDVHFKQGIDQATAKKLVKMIKDSKIKVQAQVQGEQLRVTGKKRDDLQQVMALVKEAEMGQPFQFNNFRD